MNDEYEFPHDTGQRGEECALRRAALRAREIAARTGTPLVIYRDGNIEMRVVDEAASSVAEPLGPAPQTD